MLCFCLVLPNFIPWLKNIFCTEIALKASRDNNLDWCMSSFTVLWMYSMFLFIMLPYKVY